MRYLVGLAQRALPSFLVFALALAGCQNAMSIPPRDASSGDESARLSQRGKVTLRARAGELLLDAEIASDPETRSRGLMFRRSLPEMSGMIFVFAEEAPLTFWMKNTLIPLDMLFADSSGRVVGIVENAVPLTLTPRAVDGASKFVLEVNGGWCARHGVARGDSLDLQGMFDLK